MEKSKEELLTNTSETHKGRGIDKQRNIKGNENTSICVNW
jgi:hypothetical protein